MNIKWTMSKDQKTFTAESEGHRLEVSGNAFGSWGWAVYKDDECIDCFMWHRPTNNQKDSTTVRVDCERKFAKLIKPTTP